MSRTLLAMSGALAASSLLLVDWAIKGTALLLLAAVAAVILRRDSAATRHLAWLLAIVALLFVPILSALLPQWRVLPEWAGITSRSRQISREFPSAPVIAGPIAVPVQVESGQVEPRRVDVVPSKRSRATVRHATTDLPHSAAEPAATQITTASASRSVFEVPGDALIGALLSALPIVWAVGFSVLILRLLAARWILWNCERQGTVIRSSHTRPNAQLVKVGNDTIALATSAVCLQLGIRRPVTVLLHAGKTIPVVWGVIRCCLLLPAAARQWSGEQLRSVLLHELAHIKRRDTLAQLLTQIACALYWFNPLVWLAAWRLGVERERACDDLVLASGVRPSTYAGHLLDVVTGHSSPRYLHACGLAMARQSSLEGRLTAVLAKNLNRRGVSVALASAALAIALGVAVPIAMLRAAEEQQSDQASEKSGEQPKPTTRATANMKPQNGGKLKPETEAKLDWSKPAGGLRMALCWPPVLEELPAGVPELHLAVQNVADARVRLCTTAEATQQRRLTHKSKGRIQFVIVDDKPAGIDRTLAPREVVLLRLFAPDEQGAARASAEIASGVRRMPDYSLVAEMDVSNGPAGAWIGKLTTPDTRAGVGAEAPKNRKAQELFKAWLQLTRLSGKIPGGLVARLGERVQEFVKANATDKSGAPYAKRMAPLVPRLDGTRDWQPVEAAALLGDIADVSDAPLSLALEQIAAGKIQHGLRPEKDLENAPWGEPLANGLRTACIIGPGVTSRLHYVDWVGNVVTQGAGPPDKASKGVMGADIPLGTPLGCRILIHNAGKEPVVFRTRWWHHIEPTAKDAQGAEIGMESVTRFTRAPLVTWRLEPGRYIELLSPGFGLGKYGYHDFGRADIGSWIGAKAGDQVTLTPGPLPLFDWNESPAPAGEPRWWLDFITARLALVTPLPNDAAERRELLERAIADLFLQNVNPTEEEAAAFLNDSSPQALANLAERIFQRPGVRAWAGPLQSGPTKFRVAAADPGAAKRAAEPAATPPPAAPAEKTKAGRTSSANPARLKNEYAQALYESWSIAARADGKIPGALIGLLGESVKTFIKNNPTSQATPQLEKLLSRFDASRDWSGREAAALLDELAAVHAMPIGMALDDEGQGILGTGKPLPPLLARAPWGEATADGLRVAYLLEPRAVYHRLNTSLKGRILIHNSGKQPVVFRAWSWYQASHKATDASGAVINIFSLLWLTDGQLKPFRLAPGEFIEIDTAGIGVGAKSDAEDRQDIRVGSWVEAKEGDEVTLTTEPIPLNGWNEKIDGQPRWWLDHIKARLSRHQPLPADAEARKLIVRRVAMELFGTPASEEITAAFVADTTSAAADTLARRLFDRPGQLAWAGPLQSGPTKFRVTAADPGEAKRAAEPAATPPPASPETPAEKTKTDGASAARPVLPKHEGAQALYQSWTTAARTDGRIPGALIGLLGESVKLFIKNNPTWKTTPQLEKMLPRFDASHDWGPHEAVALLGEVVAIQGTPVDMALDVESQGIIGAGEPLPPHLASGPWGQPLPNGLRLVYRLEPRSLYQRLNTKLKGRILIHNAGKQPVVFRAWSWYQAGHKATDANGENINVFSLEWTTLGRLEAHRLAPGEFIEINTAGIGVGPKTNIEDWQNIRVGTWVEAKEGDEVTLTTDPIGFSDGNEKTGDEPQWWLDHIKARLSRHLPLPADAAARKLIVSRVAMELFGTPAGDEITAAFVADTTPTALDSLARRLFQRPGQKAWSGSLVSGPTKFRVRPADPDAAKRPRVATEPGWYTLPNSVVLDVSRSRAGERIVNEATLLFYSAAPNAVEGPKQVPLKLPEGYYTWAAAMAPGTTVLWIAQKGLLQRIDFGQPENVEQARFEADEIASAPIPADLREALRTAMAAPSAP
jgi:beta-lactamase regulating signal transducer with metallopeptidase domain